MSLGTNKAQPYRTNKRHKLLSAIWSHKLLYLLMLPALVYYIIFRYVPIYGLSISFKDYNPGLGIIKSPWAEPWFKYYLQFFTSPYFVRLISNTVTLSSLKIVFGMIFPITLALLLNDCQSKYLKRTVQTLTYMPHFLSWVVIYGILLAFFSQSTGVVNNLLSKAGHPTIPFLISNAWFRQIVVLSDIWQSAGWSAIIYLAAMSGIDPNLYEASRIDGVGRMGQIRHITIPCIINTIILLLILKIGTIMDAGFDQIYNIYSVQVYPVGDIIDTWVYRTGLLQMNFSLATAVGLFKAIIGFGLVLSSNLLARRWGSGLW